MPLAKITQVSGRAVPFPGDDVDTDRIIPARYMKCLTFNDLGQYLFQDVRFDANGKSKNHPIDSEKYKGATILIAGNNFGCGSSREHAPQAIYRAGFRAVIAQGFAEIFFGNSTTLGIPCVNLSAADLAALSKQVEENPATEVIVDLLNKVVKAGDKSYSLTLRDSAREGLINGRWDAIGDLLDAIPEVEKVATKLPYMAF